jgi:hypothetical protein
VTVERTSIDGNLDGPKMSTAANRSSFDFWYFDVFSPVSNEAINIVFFNSGDLKNPNPLAVQISGTYADGTEFFGQVLAPGGALISNGSGGISGEWIGSGASFRGTSLQKSNVEYEITLHAPSIGVEGTVNFKSVSCLSSSL